MDRLNEMVQVLVTVEPMHRSQTNVLTGPLPIQLIGEPVLRVAGDLAGEVTVIYVDVQPEVLEEGRLYLYGGRLFRAVNAYPAMWGAVNSYEEVLKTSAIIKPQIFETLGLSYLGITVSGPSEVVADPGTQVHYGCVLHYGNRLGTVEIPVESGYMEWSGDLVSRNGVITVPSLDLADQVAVLNVAAQTGEGGLRWASIRVTIRKNVNRVAKALHVFGPNEVPENGRQAFIAAVEWESGALETVVPDWSVNPRSSYASIDKSGVLQVGTLRVTTAVSVEASAQVGTETLSGATAVVLKKVGDVQTLFPRTGVFWANEQRPPTQEEFEVMAVATNAYGLVFEFSSTTWVGQRAFMVAPAALGFPEIVSPGTTSKEWTTPTSVRFLVDGQPVEYLWTCTVFDNLGQRNWQSIS